MSFDGVNLRFAPGIPWCASPNSKFSASCCRLRIGPWARPDRAANSWQESPMHFFDPKETLKCFTTQQSCSSIAQFPFKAFWSSFLFLFLRLRVSFCAFRSPNRCLIILLWDLRCLTMFKAALCDASGRPSSPWLKFKILRNVAIFLGIPYLFLQSIHII